MASFKDNGVSGVISQGLGTSMLQIPNVLRKPIVLLPAVIASAIVGP
ncbi:PTS sugar transporter subunit IIC, partial [Psychrobacter sp. CMS30]